MWAKFVLKHLIQAWFINMTLLGNDAFVCFPPLDLVALATSVGMDAWIAHYFIFKMAAIGLKLWFIWSEIHIVLHHPIQIQTRYYKLSNELLVLYMVPRKKLSNRSWNSKNSSNCKKSKKKNLSNCKNSKKVVEW